MFKIIFKGAHLMMPNWLLNTLTTIGTLLLTLSVTLIFNRLVGIPKELKKQREHAKLLAEQQKQENSARDAKIAALEAAVSALPNYRAQSLQIQTQLQQADNEILAACTEIKNSVLGNQAALIARLDRLEKRDRNSIRAKLLDEFRLFTDESKNPLKAWSEMEHHAFFELVSDYEELNGNDYVHSDVIPAVNKLSVIPMSDKVALAELMASRKL